MHDYLTQRGGAERVVLAMAEAFPRAPVFTSLYELSETYPAFGAIDVRPFGINRVGLIRRNHRLGLPILGPTFSRVTVDAEVVLCSSSGWAHGVQATGKKIVYCYSPARWLYQGSRYLGDHRRLAGGSLAALRPWLIRWDVRKARECHQYLTLSSVVRDRILEIYGIVAEVLPPPHTLGAFGRQVEVPNIDPGYFLCVSRLLPYKNVDAIIQAFEGLPQRLVIVGTGPDEEELRAMSGPNITFMGRVEDPELRWLYDNSAGVIAASYEDYGLTPLEGASFGVPSAVLRWGGFLDTMVEGQTSIFFDEPTPESIRCALRKLIAHDWDRQIIKARAAEYSEASFSHRLREIVGESRDQR